MMEALTKMVTFRQLIRILESNGVQPDMGLSIAIFADSEPEKLNVLVEDGMVYVTEKRG